MAYIDEVYAPLPTTDVATMSEVAVRAELESPSRPWATWLSNSERWEAWQAWSQRQAALASRLQQF